MQRNASILSAVTFGAVVVAAACKVNIWSIIARIGIEMR